MVGCAHNRYAFAITVLDAWGKIPAAVLQLRVTWPGDMNECHSVQLNRSFSEGAVEGGWGMATIDLSKTFLSRFIQGGDLVSAFLLQLASDGVILVDIKIFIQKTRIFCKSGIYYCITEKDDNQPL